MSLNSTPASERVHIGFFGVRNAGKSSLVNRITNQDMSLVSEVKGTTTDAVKKSMELLPIGPVVIIDTAGIDDEGELGSMRVEATKRVLKTCNIAVLVTENEKLLPDEVTLLKAIKERDIPYLIAHNKSDITEKTEGKLYVSAKTGEGIEELKNEIAKALGMENKKVRFIADFIKKGDTAVLVTPIDSSAPKARMILPQQQAIRDILDAEGICVVTQVEQLTAALENLKSPPALVVTDSQAFSEVMKLVPKEIPLTSFSILMARYKGFLSEAVKGSNAIDRLSDGARVLICEGCTHHRQCEDIGTVKIPRLLKAYTGAELKLEFTSGHGFPDDLGAYDLIIHCGGCMLNDAEMKSRIDEAIRQGVPITNYGTALAKFSGILNRSIEIIK
ncbi:MAG: [Eubacterium sp.]|nr:[FeFe] hydrogenase H-cluster maturation GTPase HydF [Eubacterium sp.]MBR7073390.1 [FeFe] hydrogenase H-cluster maturation GTPase HydF [Eubacterium sp.]